MANYWNINMANDERRTIGRTATGLEPGRWRPYWATHRVTWGSGGHGSYSMKASGLYGILQRGGESTVIPIYSTVVPISTTLYSIWAIGMVTQGTNTPQQSHSTIMDGHKAINPGVEIGTSKCTTGFVSYVTGHSSHSSGRTGILSQRKITT